MSEEELRVGVFVCKCGKNIAHTIDCDAVAEYAKDLPDVVFTGVNMFSCSDPGQQEIEDKIQEHNLNRVVVAACTPRTHEPIFRECVKRAGVNQYLFELANIREHASWVHQKEPEKATEKAKDIVNMAVSKARLLEPLEDLEVNMEPASLIIGAGIAGIRAALDIADQGYQVVLVEKKPTIGGIMALIDKTFPTQDCSICILGPLMTEVGRHPNVKLISNAVVERIDGYVGNFDVSVRKFARFVDESLCKNCGDCADVCPVTVPNEFDENISWRKAIYIPFPQAVPSARVIDPDDCLGMNPITCGKCRDVCEPKAINYDDQDEVFDYKIGTIIVSTGFEIADPLDNPEFGWGRFKNVLTSMEFERIINAAGPTDGHLVRPSDHVEPQKIAFIQCVGSRDVNNNPYCSVFCCMETIKSSLLIKEHYPDAEITVYYMDIRAAGKRFEEIYTSSREQGVKYIRSSIAEIKEDPLTKNLFLSGEDTTKGKYINNEHDLVVLSMGAQKSNESELPLPLSRTPENFYMEAHPKLKPVDTPTAGVFLAGGAESPKSIHDSVTQASAAAGRAIRLMSQGMFPIEGITVQVIADNCTGCGICVERCPYGALEVIDKKLKVTTALCSGCGTCVADCPRDALVAPQFTDEQIKSQISAALETNPEEKLIAFVCNWCSYGGSDLAGISRLQQPTNPRLIRTMCSGRISRDIIQHAYNNGAGSILLSGCHPADCHYLSGNHWAEKRVKRIRSWMKREGIDDWRFRLEWVSAGEGKRWQNLMTEMSEQLIANKETIKPPVKTKEEAS